MNNIIKFPEKTDSDLFAYFEDEAGNIAIKTIDGQIEIHKLYLSSQSFVVGDKIINREELSQFLWASAYFLDSEKRYMPEGELVGINYTDEE